MFARVAVLTLPLSGPALIAPLPASEPDLARMREAIVAGHPMFTARDKLTPVEELVEVAREAEQGIESAPPSVLHPLINYDRVARMTAYDRTGDPRHACALIADCDLLLARKDAPDEAVQEAREARSEAMALCVPPTTPSPSGGAETPPGSPPVRLDAQPKRPRFRVNVGAIVMGAAGAYTILAAVGAGLAIRSRNEFRDHAAELQAQGTRTEWDDVLLDFERTKFKADRAFAIVMGALAGVAWVVGGVLHAQHQRHTRQLTLTPFGGPRGSGLMWTGRF